MSPNAIEWAASHDWFEHAAGGRVFVRDVATWTRGCEARGFAAGQVVVTLKAFASLQALRAWAGY